MPRGYPRVSRQDLSIELARCGLNEDAIRSWASVFEPAHLTSDEIGNITCLIQDVRASLETRHRVALEAQQKGLDETRRIELAYRQTVRRHIDEHVGEATKVIENLVKRADASEPGELGLSEEDLKVLESFFRDQK